MESKAVRGILISDFNIENLAGYLRNDDNLPPVAATAAPFGQVAQALLGSGLEVWEDEFDFAVVWTSPGAVIERFQSVLNHEDASLDQIMEEVDDYATQLSKLLDRVRFVFVPLWVTPAFDRGFGLLDLKTGHGITNTLMRMNVRLMDACAQWPNIHFLNTNRWVASVGPHAFHPKLWYMAKIAFANEVFQEAALDIKSALTAVVGGAKKLIILDLDNTLWGGIVGDAGWENLVLGGHNPVGEGYADFQRALKALTRRGILLAIVSKNEEDIALEAISSHPEMVLKEDDFVGWKINWLDKAANIQELVTELNLGMQSVVFIDDSPVERARVRDSLPEVFVPEWPAESMFYKSALLSLPFLDATSVSSEDIDRTRQYISERKRKTSQEKVGSLDEWLMGLGLRVEAGLLAPANLQRAAQLLNKTNQMNLSTRRLTEEELTSWAKEAGHAFWTFRVSDKFGDYGLTGLLGVEVDGERARIVDYVLSCRVMARRIEETLLHVAINHARSRGVRSLVAHYLPTKKNKPCFSFFKGSGMDFDEETKTFTWSAEKEYPLPEPVHLELVES